jgi:hypothetical protein
MLFLAMGLSLCLYGEDVGPSGRGSKVGCGKVVAIACTSIIALLQLGNAVATDSKPRDNAAASACSRLCSCQVLLSAA